VRVTIGVAALVALGVWAGAARAADSVYWGYQYEDIEVTAAGSSEYAVRLAHNLKRFDQALVKILHFDSPKRVPVKLYALAPRDMERLMGKDVAYAVRPYRQATLIVTSSGWGSGGGGYQGAYFGYIEGLLVSNGAEHYPPWYRYGVPMMLSDVSFVGDRLTVGGVLHTWSQTIAAGVWMPIRTLLQARAHDPVVREDMFVGESWYLAREVFIEGKYRDEFLHYLALIGQGQSEADAYQAAFTVPYETFDHMLQAARSEAWHQYVMHVTDSPGSEHPVRLSTQEAQARLALLERHEGAP